MGAGKIFAGLSIPLIWIISYYLILPKVLGYEEFKLVESLAPGIWLIAILLCVGFIFWGLRD